MSDRTLSSAAGGNINLLRLLVAARATTSVVFWTCFLEVVGAIFSVFLACYGGGVKPHVVMHVAFVPGTLQAGTARQRTACSNWRATRAAIKMISRFCCCYSRLADFVLVLFRRLQPFVHHSPKTRPRRLPTRVKTRSGRMVMAGSCRRSEFKNGMLDKVASRREAVGGDIAAQVAAGSAHIVAWFGAVAATTGCFGKAEVGQHGRPTC